MDEIRFGGKWQQVGDHGASGDDGCREGRRDGKTITVPLIARDGTIQCSGGGPTSISSLVSSYQIDLKNARRESAKSVVTVGRRTCAY